MSLAVGKIPGSSAAVSAGAFAGVLSSRRNISLLVLVAALLAGAIGISIYKPAAITDFFDRSSMVLAQGAQAAGNTPLARGIAALIGQRSPGARTAGELTNNKQRYAENIRHYRARPQQRALAKTRPGLPAPFVQALTTPAQELLPVPSPAESLVAPLVQNIPIPVGGFSSPPVIGGGGPGGGGGDPGPGGGGGPPPADVPAVPEPATWLTMILGFALCARALKKQRVLKSRACPLAA